MDKTERPTKRASWELISRRPQSQTQWQRACERAAPPLDQPGAQRGQTAEARPAVRSQVYGHGLSRRAFRPVRPFVRGARVLRRYGRGTGASFARVLFLIGVHEDSRRWVARVVRGSGTPTCANLAGFMPSPVGWRRTTLFRPCGGPGRHRGGFRGRRFLPKY
jgi:hypothetical protein